MTQKYSDYQYLLAYALLAVIIMLLVRTKWGYTTVYYLLGLFCFSLVLLHPSFIVNTLRPISGTGAYTP